MQLFSDLSLGRPVALAEMLNAREKRARRQRSLQSQHGMVLICFTLNLAGPHKAFPLARRTFLQGKRWILRQLESAGHPAAGLREELEDTGDTLFLVTGAPVTEAKRLMTAIEESTPLGRLMDIDVLDVGGTKATREQIGFSRRKCLLCGEDAFVCSRSRAHSWEALLAKSAEIMGAHFADAFANRMTQLAVQSLLYEVATTPKPGLVDRANNGAHSDMDLFTFAASSASLIPYFRDCTLAGIGEADPVRLFQKARFLGRQAEDAMFAATAGVNTHKGLVFSLGLACGAAGHLHERDALTGPDALLDCCSAMTIHLMDDFEGVTQDTASSNGEKLYAVHGFTGIRGEAAAGFPSIRKYSLPVFTRLMEDGQTQNDAGVVTLMHLIANVQDTNIIHRSSMQALVGIQASVRALLSQSPTPQQVVAAARELDSQWILRNISPGGCADLLVLTYLLYFLFRPGD